jgi:predicted metal-binding membrane protein
VTSPQGRLERVLRHDRLVLAVVLAGLTALCWAQMAAGAGAGQLLPCCGARFSITFSMWLVMMAGMMIPTVAPMVLVHAAIVRRSDAPVGPWRSSGLFLAGYLLTWSAFSAAAAGVQTLLYRTALLDGRSLAVGPWAGAAVLLAAGVFQFSSAKNRCLRQCRHPIGYFLTGWRQGPAGSLSMGVRHGAACVGCCWLLMALLFAVGIMNIVWSAVITAFVMAEKILPWPRAVAWSGGALCLAGAALMVARAV